MKKIELNDLLINGSFDLGLKVGLFKHEVEKALGVSLGNADIKTPDLNLYYIEIKSGIVLSMIFDKEDVCYEISMNIDENKDLNLFVQFDQRIEQINAKTSFEKLITIISDLKIEWEFDNKRVYLQTVCIRLKNELRLYFAFGNRNENDFGLFSIKSILDTHKLNTL